MKVMTYNGKICAAYALIEPCLDRGHYAHNVIPFNTALRWSSKGNIADRLWVKNEGKPFLEMKLKHEFMTL